MKRLQLLAGAMAIGLAAGATQAMALTAAPVPGDASFIRVAAGAYDLSYSVKNVQALLNQLGYDAGTADGMMGLKTRNAIRTFERDVQLPVTGEPSRMLFQRLQQAAAAESGDKSYSTTQGYASSSTVARSTTSGDVELRSSDVLALEQQLKRLGYSPGKADGVYDSKTRTAIQRYQQDQGLAVDGRATASLLASVESEDSGSDDGYGQDYQQGYASPQTIQQIEQSLSQKGYRVGPVDGRMDAQTQTAIDDFIRHAQLNISNAPSPQLLAAINNSSMTAQQGSKRDMIDTGVNAITNMFSK